MITERFAYSKWNVIINYIVLFNMLTIQQMFFSLSISKEVLWKYNTLGTHRKYIVSGNRSTSNYFYFHIFIHASSLLENDPNTQEVAVSKFFKSSKLCNFQDLLNLILLCRMFYSRNRIEFNYWLVYLLRFGNLTNFYRVLCVSSIFFIK